MAATVNYLAMDRPDPQFTANVLGRTTARPTQRSWANLKRSGRYLISHPRVLFEHALVPESEVGRFVGHSDSDWAGCKSSRRSTSGGVVK